MGWGNNCKVKGCLQPVSGYLTNSHYCEKHLDLANRRDAALSGLHDRANAKDASPADKLLRADFLSMQPDMWNHGKYLEGK